MKIVKLFHRSRKEKEEKVEIAVQQPSELELICGDDKEVYEALNETLLLNILSLPSREFSMEEALEKAKEKEGSGDLYMAGLEYRMAGQIALFNGDIGRAKEFLGKAQELTGKRYLILAVLDRAVEKARDYYQKKKEENKQKK